MYAKLLCSSITNLVVHRKAEIIVFSFFFFIIIVLLNLFSLLGSTFFGVSVNKKANKQTNKARNNRKQDNKSAGQIYALGFPCENFVQHIQTFFPVYGKFGLYTHMYLL